MDAEPLILQMKYVSIVKRFADKLNLSLDDALRIFYESEVYQFMRDGVSDMHCMSEEYIIEDLEEEYHSGRTDETQRI